MIALVFSQQALEFLVADPLANPLIAVLVIAVANLIVALLRQRPFQKKLWRPYHWYVLSHLFFFIAATALATIFPAKGPPNAREISTIAAGSLTALFYGSLISTAFWIWRMRGFRWLAGSLMAVLELPVISAVLVAGIYVTGATL